MAFELNCLMQGLGKRLDLQSVDRQTITELRAGTVLPFKTAVSLLM